MKIEPSKPYWQIYNTEIKKRGTVHSDKTNPHKDRIEISDKARDFAESLKRMREAPEIRTHRINDISERMNNGTYSIPAEKVAESMIRNAKLTRSP